MPRRAPPGSPRTFPIPLGPVVLGPGVLGLGVLGPIAPRFWVLGPRALGSCVLGPGLVSWVLWSWVWVLGSCVLALPGLAGRPGRAGCQAGSGHPRPTPRRPRTTVAPDPKPRPQAQNPTFPRLLRSNPVPARALFAFVAMCALSEAACVILM